MKNPLLVPEFQELLAEGKEEELRAFCTECHPATVGEMLSALEPAQAWAVLRLAEPVRRAEIFSHLDEQEQEELVETLRRDDIARLFADMPPDDRAHLFRRLPEARQELVMPALAQAEREDIRRLMSYEQGTAGSIMTSDYATIPPDVTAAEAIERLRRVAPDKETIYYSYVVDDNRKLLGLISLRDLIVARREARVRDLYRSEVIYARADEDQEEAARKIQKFDLLALPVVNADNALVGIITYDDAIDVITQEHTEDMEKMMAIGGSHEGGAYLRMSPWEHFRNRAAWVAALGVVGLLSGFIVQRYEGLLQEFTLLAAFMPMLAGAGGNTGSQSAALVVRGLALDELAPRDLPRILLKELQVSLLIGALLGAIVFVRVLLHGGACTLATLERLGLTIAIAVGLQVVTATLVGALLPMIAAKLKFDPAVVANPALTTIVDVTGMLIYFSVASAMLGA